MLLHHRTSVFALIAFSLLFLGYFGFVHTTASATVTKTAPRAFGMFGIKPPVAEPQGADTLVVVGDVLLARDVERKITEFGAEYPFSKIKSQLEADVVLGNFEAAVPVIHKETADLSTVFSVSSELVYILNDAGFTHMSLANNHSLDFDTDGYINTQNQLATNTIEAIGHQKSLATTSIAYVDVDSITVAVLTISTIPKYPDTDTWQLLLELASAQSDFQIVYVHWGAEYELVHSKAQEKFAHALIDAGADMIIGHHPHVVQDIELYNGGLIFYSLGNFLFDQYFDDEVQKGLLLTIDFDENAQSVQLTPITSLETRAQPHGMTADNTKIFLKALADRSSKAISKEIIGGVLSF